MVARLMRAHTHSGLAIPPPPAGRDTVKRSHSAVGKTGIYINNISNTSETDREDFLIAMIRPLVVYGASFNMIEERLLALARHFNIKVTVVRRPRTFVCIIGDYGKQRRKIQIKDGRHRHPDFTGLIEVHETYVAVVHDEIKLGQGVEAFNSMPTKKPVLVQPSRHMVLAAVLAGSIGIAFFGATVGEALVAAGATIALSVFQLLCLRAGGFYALFTEIIVTVLLSLVAHDRHTLGSLSNIAVSILPGHLYMSNALRNAEDDGHVSPEGYIKSLVGIVYAAVLSAGLPIISDLYLMSRLYMLVILGRTLGDKVMRRRTVLTVRAQKPRKPEAKTMEMTTTVVADETVTPTGMNQ